MNFKIMHESRGRIRIQSLQRRMTLEQADLLEAYLLTIAGVRQAAVHERTCCAVIRYQGPRAHLLRKISDFSYHTKGMIDLMPIHSGRALNRAY